jgi:hypothetical protein
MKPDTIDFFWNIQRRIEGRAFKIGAAYNRKRKPFNDDYIEGLLVAGIPGIMAGIGIGFLLWGGA